MPTVFEGAPTPLRIVFTTVFVLGPAALVLVFCAAIADGGIAKEKTSVEAMINLLAFMVHQNSCVGVFIVNL